jgi:hypothetical protein
MRKNTHWLRDIMEGWMMHPKKGKSSVLSGVAVRPADIDAWGELAGYFNQRLSLFENFNGYRGKRSLGGDVHRMCQLLGLDCCGHVLQVDI